MVISVRVFAPGTRGATPTWGPAAGIHQQRLRQPVQFASLLVGSNGPEANNLGTGLGAGGITPIAVDGRSFPYGSDPAVIGAHKVGAVICNGQWVQVNIQVPSDHPAVGTGTNPGYWNLWYGVGPNPPPGTLSPWRCSTWAARFTSSRAPEGGGWGVPSPRPQEPGRR